MTVATVGGVSILESRSIPVIDLGPYLAGARGAREHAAAEVRHALTDVGFFSIIGHGIDWALVEAIYQQARRYHQLPLEEKQTHLMTAGAMGYIPLGGAKRGDQPAANNAAFFLGRPGSKRNQLPAADAIPGFAEAITDYYQIMETLCQQLLPLYALAADVEPDYFDRFFDPALATLRMSYYPPVESNQSPDSDSPGTKAPEPAMGIDPHSDAGFMTLLPTNPVAGLQIRPDGEDWFAVAQESQSFVVNSGDTLRRWSNDRFRSTVHRAINESGGDRYAIPFFFDPRVDTEVACLAGCTSPENPPRHEPLIYRDYLQSFMEGGYPQLALGSDRST